MRIISGQYKGKKLNPPKDNNIRPTSDRLRESLFNIILHNKPEIEDSYVMDIFAGTGAMGLEALSRGAQQCIFIEKNQQSLQILQSNISLLDVAEKAVIMQKNVSFLGMSPAPYHHKIMLAMLDAPFERSEELTMMALKNLDQGEWLADKAWVIAKLPNRVDLEDMDRFSLLRTIKAGSSKGVIWEYNKVD